MIRVFFTIRLDGTLLPERTGQWVRDAEEARAVAATIVRRLVRAHGGEPRLLDAALVVTDEAGANLLDLSFFEALYVPIAPQQRSGLEPVRGAQGRHPPAQGSLERLDGALSNLREACGSRVATMAASLRGIAAGTVRRRSEPSLPVVRVPEVLARKVLAREVLPRKVLASDSPP